MKDRERVQNEDYGLNYLTPKKVSLKPMSSQSKSKTSSKIPILNTSKTVVSTKQYVENLNEGR